MLRKSMAATAAAALAVMAGGAGAAYAQDEQYTIGISNGWVGSEWRTQMIDEVEAAAEAWAERGVDVELLVQSADVDVQGQIAHVRNFINQGVDAIIINPNSPTAFDPIFAQAAQQGILVIATDAEVSSPDAYYVGIDQKQWAQQSAEWLAEQLGGEGRIVAINGVAGHPGNQMRVEGYTEVFAEHPGIEILNEANANWDQGQGQQTMRTLLATYPDLDGVWVQDGMADGAWRALTEEGKAADVAATGEIRVDFLQKWMENDWNTAASVNPPGVMASALNVAVHMLQGREFAEGALQGPNGKTLYLPIPFIDNENVAEMYEQVKDQPGHHSVSSSLTIDEAAEFFAPAAE